MTIMKRNILKNKKIKRSGLSHNDMKKTALDYINEGIIINRWTQFHISNKDSYRKKIENFLNKNFFLEVKKDDDSGIDNNNDKKNLYIKNKINNGTTRLSKYVEKKYSNLSDNEDGKKRIGLIFLSKKDDTPMTSLTIEKRNERVRKLIKKFIENNFKNEYTEEEKIYEIVNLGKITLNKRKITELKIGIDYDSLPYKSPVLKKTITLKSKDGKKIKYKVAISFFEHSVKFFAYPTEESIKEEAGFLQDIIDNYSIK